MGTMLYAQGIFINRSFDSLNLNDPQRVLAVHRAYAQAGADVLETNTFGANRIKLRAFGLADRLREINEAGARLAREGASGTAHVAGAIGPLGLRIEPWGRMGRDEAHEYFREQAQALLDGGVDLFILETFRDLNEISAAIGAVRSVCGLPIVAQMTIEDDGNTLDGTAPEQFAPALQECRSGRDRSQLQHRSGAHAGDARADDRGYRGSAVRAAECGTAARRRRADDLPDVALNTWRPTRGVSSSGESGSSEGAAARRPITSPRSSQPCRSLALTHRRGPRAPLVEWMRLPGRRRCRRRFRSVRQRSRSQPGLRQSTLGPADRSGTAEGPRDQARDRSVASVARTRHRRDSCARRCQRATTERAVTRRPDSTAGRHRCRAAVLVPRQALARLAVGTAGRPRVGYAQPACL